MNILDRRRPAQCDLSIVLSHSQFVLFRTLGFVSYISSYVVSRVERIVREIPLFGIPAYLTLPDSKISIFFGEEGRR